MEREELPKKREELKKKYEDWSSTLKVVRDVKQRGFYQFLLDELYALRFED